MTGPAMGALPLVAADLGASSGRVVLGRVGPDSLELTEVHRFRNGPVHLPDGLYWDAPGLYLDVLEGIRAVVRGGEHPAGLAVDSWAVDYGLVEESGRLRGNPRHYRDSRTEAVIPRVHERVPRADLYAVNGLQFLPFNTLYQFAAEPDLDGVQALLIPDLLGFWLTGRRVAEETNASTTGLLDARTGLWSSDLVTGLGLPADLLPELVPAGARIGGLRAEVRAAVGVDVPVTTTGSHDTASAVLGVPATGPGFGYVSCGTWGLVGVELEQPVITGAGRAANFTNERGIDGTTRHLRNVMGLWLLSECVREWSLRGDADRGALLQQAAARPAGGPVFDVDDPVFLPPGDMPARIAAACPAVGDDRVATVRCILDSLAEAFARALRDAELHSGQRIEVVHVVGGGAQNTLLCQLLADTAGLPVVAGPVEATAIGNLLVQARTHGVLTGDRWSLRDLVRRTQPLVTYRPRDPAGTR